MPGVQGGLRAEFDQEVGTHISDVNCAVLPHERGRELVQRVLALIFCLGMQGLGPVLLPGPLGDGKLFLDSVIPLRRELLAIAGHRGILEPEVDPC